MTSEIERWISIPGYEGIYEVSDAGRIRSLPRVDCREQRRAGKIIKPYRDGKKGYVAVSLVKNGVSTRRKVHRLVAAAFCARGTDADQVNHKNGKPNDNRACNLEWCTQRENIIHAFRELGRKSSGGHRGKFGDNHHCSRAVLAAKVGGDEVMRFGSAAEAGRALGIPSGSIPRCCAGKYKSSHGWTFQYERGST
jgi:hypothetical protein